MKAVIYPITVLCLAAAGFAGGGCANVSSTARRAGVLVAGSGVGAAAGHLLSHGDTVTTAAGAVAGAGLTALALGEDAAVRQEGFDRGYIQGQSDAIKRQYFYRQAAEAQPLPQAASGGDVVYYVLPGPEVTADGRRLEPHQVAVKVVE